MIFVGVRLCFALKYVGSFLPSSIIFCPYVRGASRASSSQPATGEDLAATAEYQVGARLFSVLMQNLYAPTWYRQISVAVPQLRHFFLTIDALSVGACSRSAFSTRQAEREAVLSDNAVALANAISRGPARSDRS